VAGSLLGTKTILNELVAYLHYAALPVGTLDPRSGLIMVYALCGFANFGSVGILIAGMSALMPETPGRDRAPGPACPGLGHLGERIVGVHDRTSQLIACLGRSMRVRAILLCLALAGCAAATAPPGSETVTPHVEDGVLVARDGARLPLRQWDAEGGAPKAVIIALHGMSDYSNAFDTPAKSWAKRGIATLAIDQRGFGRSAIPACGRAAT